METVELMQQFLCALGHTTHMMDEHGASPVHAIIAVMQPALQAHLVVPLTARPSTA